ncbi:hypothetical protein CEXT_497791 [Caerostris extrusa]|uniref:Uncharacterized protein n=1 Tax=Caerostris extrusa TaxID=172846 RepID=A0AAV4TRS7_CAEEX|nr:hypothetical protein CEXT_497791 [Caerostris extrusa]
MKNKKESTETNCPEIEKSQNQLITSNRRFANSHLINSKTTLPHSEFQCLYFYPRVIRNESREFLREIEKTKWKSEGNIRKFQTWNHHDRPREERFRIRSGKKKRNLPDIRD